MTISQRELVTMIETLPEELSNKVIDYIDYLKFASLTDIAPEHLIVKSKQDLRKKLEVGIKDSDSGNTFSSEEVFSEIDALLAE